MQTTPQQVIPTDLGTPFAGGFYVGQIRVNEQVFALIIAPKAEGEHEPIAWGKSRKALPEARSFCDGRANIQAMAAAGSKLAQWALDLRIGGFDDWYLPARDELELIYRYLKPTARDNYCWSGDNPSSVPPGYAYFPESPAQTSAEAFRDGGAEALADSWYWSSTQCAGDDASAWYQDFINGSQSTTLKSLKLRARAVRRLAL